MADLEEAFKLIEEGNNATDRWKAAELFCRAQSILKRLSLEQPQDSEENVRVAELFQQQSNENLHRSREALLKAMQDEATKDHELGEQTHQSLSDEQAEERLNLFSRLFCREMETAAQREKPMMEKQSSLEERLMELNKSLPKGFKTSQERMNEINRGLGRLGLSLYSNSEPQNNIDVPKSETDQVQDIIAQAKDEVALQGPDKNNESTNVDDSDDDDESLPDESSSSSSSAIDEQELSPEVIADIQEKVVVAQARLAELVALTELDKDDEAEIAFDQATGKKALRDAQRLLKQVAARWNEK